MCYSAEVWEDYRKYAKQHVQALVNFEQQTD